jgi:hypothetical protein
VDALKIQMGDVAETPTTTFVDGDNNSRGNTAVETPVSREIYDPTYDIANFFSRPVEITSGTWAIDGELDTVFNPWYLWAINSRICNRLNNYKYFDGELCVKLVINGNPFAWGCLMMSYLPNSNPNFAITTDPRNFQPSTFFCDIMQASQRMHVLIDPTTSKGGELCIPLHTVYTGQNLSASPFGNVGEIWLRSINTLRQLGSTKPITYTVYAWANKVKLSAPTQTNMSGLVAQAGETSEGTLAQSLNLAANVAAAATKVPVIGKWANAAETAMRLGADVASAFGFSRPLSQDVTKRTVSVFSHPLSVMDGLDTALPLGSEFNQNVTVDPETIGFGGGDEMNIAKIAAIPSLVYVSNWLPANTKNTLLCNFKVSPFISRSGTRSLINAQARQFTPAGMAALNFAFWRGTMRVRVQVVANSFHRGRLLIAWDPNLSNASPQEQVVRNMIVDIAEQRDFSFDVGMCSIAPLLYALDNESQMANYEPNQTPQSDVNLYSNGVVSIYVLNELISNVTSTTPVQVNVWTSFVDFQGFEPSFRAASNMGLYPTAPTVALRGDFDIETVKEDEVLEPQSGLLESNILGNEAPDSHVLIQPVSKALPIGLHTGSAVESFRKIAKRWVFVRNDTSSVTTTVANRYGAIREVIPTSPICYGPGYTVSGWDGTGTNARKTIPLTPIAFNHQAYVFSRGGFRIGFKFKAGSSGFDTIISRGFQGTTLVRTITSDMDENAFISYKRAFDRSADGCVVSNNVGFFAVEVPFGATRKMAPTSLTTTATTLFESSAIVLDMEVYNLNAATRTLGYDQYLAGAEDYSLHWFRGCPCLYTYTPP